MTIDEVLNMMRQGMGKLPPAIEKAAVVDPALVMEHVRSKGFAMPADKPALDEQTRTLVYLAAALAGSSTGCVQAMANKIAQQGIPADKVLETVHIVRLAMASKIIGDADPVLAVLMPKA